MPTGTLLVDMPTDRSVDCPAAWQIARPSSSGDSFTDMRLMHDLAARTTAPIIGDVGGSSVPISS
jgi:hypothetical protein